MTHDNKKPEMTSSTSVSMHIGSDAGIHLSEATTAIFIGRDTLYFWDKSKLVEIRDALSEMIEGFEK